MRDPNRIDPTLAKIAAVWKRHPDMRLGQLVWALAGKDPFYTEDDQLVCGINMKRLTAQ